MVNANSALMAAFDHQLDADERMRFVGAVKGEDERLLGEDRACVSHRARLFDKAKLIVEALDLVVCGGVDVDQGLAVALGKDHFVVVLAVCLKGLVGIPVTEENVTLYSQANDAQWKKLERGETTQAKLRVDRFHDFLSITGLQADAQALLDDYVVRLGQQRFPLPGAEELCRAVSAHMPIWLVTNGISQIQRSRFTDCLLTPYLSGRVISEEVGASKPDPAMLFEALRQA